MKKLHLETVCGSSSSTITAMVFLILLERANIAVNALIAKQAAAARLLVASQSLAKCREQNNPYLPGNSGPFGPSRAQLYGPDPCLTQEKELAGATTAHMEAVALAQKSAAPTAQDLQAAPAPQLSSSYDVPDTDPAVPETEHIVPAPALNNTWSPNSLLEIMDMIAQEIETSDPGWLTDAEMIDQLEIIYRQGLAFLHWLPGLYPTKPRKPYKYQPKNENWIGKWAP
ncbi:nonstructural protein 2 [Galliform chaphamaparvovirus 17]|nr:nonstructural protein 2 [Galliform chaphamaparvovirus 17]